jgi:hypothetical protein
MLASDDTRAHVALPLGVEDGGDHPVRRPVADATGDEEDDEADEVEGQRLQLRATRTTIAPSAMTMKL